MPSQTEKVKLTQYSHGTGCGCKIAPSKLEEILGSEKTKSFFPLLLIGNETRDDAAVYDLQNGTALITTADFFMPIVNDAYDFGRIAAANSISDVYAMGGKPAFAIALLGFPVEKLSAETAAEIMSGAKEICREAGIPIAGGHSISSNEPFFGLSVNGFIDSKNLKRNNTASEGDILFLTKPIGTGILSTAIKREIIKPEDYKIVVDIMSTLNKAGSEFGKIKGVSAMTDVTGFGLLGHLLEMVDGDRLSAEISVSSIPLFPGLDFYISQLCFPDNTYRNWNSYEKKVSKGGEQHFITLCDPQTNGGLLVSVHPESVQEFLDSASQCGLNENSVKPIGKVIARQRDPVILIG